ncbi:SLC13 family permease [Nocardioides acrostichi]|uniref:Arsenic transporter n=1 Tax=Nocardioides acrostichi TaxID=2784339 RepID=A0A930Y8Y6_9ACTN|nr:SLC13 family permease [Nocardioides acrostichi]MBF4163597.1 arsenic transporter [Nocardioides acrostichi]
MPDLVGGLALLALLIAAWRGPRASVEAVVAVAASAAVLGVGLIDPATAFEAVDRLAPVLVFLAAVLVVAEVCARAGVFEAAATLLRGGSGPRLLLSTLLLAAVVTAVLSLDATVVLVTPVVVAAAVARGARPGPVAWACLRMANSASLLLPVSNLTNLLAARSLDLTFLGFARAMAPVWLVVVAAEWAIMRLQLRADLVAPPDTAAPRSVRTAPPGGVVAVPVATVIVMLVLFAALSPLGVAPAWVAAPAAVGLAAWAATRGLLRPVEAAHATQPSFVLFVFGLGVVVAALVDGGLGTAVERLLPSSTGLLGLLVVAAVATALANLVTNLSATLLLVPLVAPLGTDAVLAALVGLGAGAGLTYSGSLANLLWRRGLSRGLRPGTEPPDVARLTRFHALSLVSTPVVVVVGVITLHVT